MGRQTQLPAGTGRNVYVSGGVCCGRWRKEGGGWDCCVGEVNILSNTCFCLSLHYLLIHLIHLFMNTKELKRELIRQIESIDDPCFLNAK